MKKFILLLLFVGVNLTFAQTRFSHILITNDDGIEDADRLLALAKGVSNVADRVSIVVSEFDRSGTSNHTTFGKHQSTLQVTCKYYDKENNIAVYTTPGNPADCVILGLGGLFGDDVPELVLSGINGGPNIGPEWFGSGTIGAVRMAAYFGVKAIAFSGFDSDNEKSFSVIPDWIAKFILSGFINDIDKYSYLTVGFPEIPFEEIKGSKLIERRVTYDKPEALGFKRIYGDEPNIPKNTTVWTLDIKGNPFDMEVKLDDYYLHQGFITITPMTIDENDNTLKKRLEEKVGLIPEFNK